MERMRHKGFTLFEMLICIIVMSIFIIEAFTFAANYNHSKLDSTAKEIAAAVRFAKFFAIIKGEKLILRCFASEDCSKGLTLHAIGPKNQKELIKIWDWSSATNKIYWHGFGINQELIFSPDIKRNATNGEFKIFYQNEVYISVVVNRYGKTRIVKT